jgi:acetoin utilization deacetylase AcuC-like enzyme
VSEDGPQLLMIEQPRERGEAGAVPWILDIQGRRTPGYDDGRRLSEVQAGLVRHRGVTAHAADASPEEIERVLRRLHEPDYLRALQRVRGRAPVLMAELAQPGLEPDTPVCAQAVASALEGVGVAIAAARRIVAGARFSYALCRPPGHHAGPGWLGGYCYLNNAAAAAHTLDEGGLGRVAILDLDLHYPNGTSALLERMPGTTLHSLHGSTGANLPWERVRARTEREHLLSFRSPPAPRDYLEALATCTHALARSADAIVLSLGYDTVEGDPHGSWSFQPSVFERIGCLLADTGLPVCVVQEGGYALESLAACSHAFATGLLSGSEAASAS